MDDDRPPIENSSWGQYRRLILAELERISKDISNTNEKIDIFRQQDVTQMKTDIALLKFQAALYGSLAGILSTGIVTVVLSLIRF